MPEINYHFHPGQIEISGQSVPNKLLGELETEVMGFMWEIERAPVQHIVQLINRQRPIAYTTVMTVMVHLVDKGLLTRTPERNKYIYQVAQNKDEFLRTASRNMVRSLLHDFGDLAIAGFLVEISKIQPEKLEEIRDLLRAANDEDTPSR
jgi:predicted transcriptional regulator